MVNQYNNISFLRPWLWNDIHVVVSVTTNIRGLATDFLSEEQAVVVAEWLRR